MIYVDLKGRIGNQLFIYAFAEALRKERGRNEKIIFCDYPILQMNWVNSLEYYNLENVEFEHGEIHEIGMRIRRRILGCLYRLFTNSDDYTSISKFEKKVQPILSCLGIVALQDGYLNISCPSSKNIYVTGYFQSAKFFEKIDYFIVSKFRLEDRIISLQNKDVDLIKSRNSVCISIKVEHNVGNYIYDVCTKEYWENAIDYIIEKVENPLFFICSDNVDYVKENLINTEKYDTLCQDMSLPVHLSLAIMGNCKHFLIGNTTFGWWAQHISNYKDKIVVAPSRWYNIDLPVDIYEPGWKLIEV